MFMNNAAAIHVNPNYGQSRNQIDSFLSGGDTSHQNIRSHPLYAATPLHNMNEVAEDLCVASFLLKDESRRFGVGNFKTLGVVEGVISSFEKKISREVQSYSVRDLYEGRYRHILEKYTVVAASDGNYGHALSWFANTIGCKSVVFLNDTSAYWRRDRITSQNGRVVLVEGNYEDAVSAAKAAADQNGWVLISDTAYSPEEAIPNRVMHGYRTLSIEILNQWPIELPPTHVFLQVGVGGLAAASMAQLASNWPEAPIRFLAVEPKEANCAFQSGVANRSVTVPGDHNTLCAGLACGRLSASAWPLIQESVFGYVSIHDQHVLLATRYLSENLVSANLAIGETGIAGFAAAMTVCRNSHFREALNIDENSRILAVATEGKASEA